jgi:tetratricopeptide (TPR) repeat protein
MRNVLICIISLLISGCSVKWADKIAEKGFDKECINQYSKAMKIYNRGILLNKGSAELYWRRGNLYARNENHQMAIIDLTKSIELDSLFNGGNAYWDRAISKEELGDLYGALSDFDKAVLIDPEKENFYLFRGTLKYRMVDYRGALNDFDNAIKYWNDYYIARSWRSMLRVELKDFEGAMEDFNYLRFSNEDELNPEMASEFRNRGIAKFNTKDTIGACNDWKIAAKHNDSISLVRIKENCK